MRWSPTLSNCVTKGSAIGHPSKSKNALESVLGSTVKSRPLIPLRAAGRLLALRQTSLRTQWGDSVQEAGPSLGLN
jgi:hypothetical protein